MSNIKGDWDFSPNVVFKVQQQSDESVKIYKCNRTKYLETDGYCSYIASEILVGTYNSRWGGFCLPQTTDSGHKACATGLQVSFEYPNEILEIIDPLRIYNFKNSGEIVEGRKIR